MNGIFITLEGIDGCGKSTQADHLAKFLTGLASEREIVKTAEPGGWPSGSALRDLILHGKIPDARSEFLLFLADRSAHVATVICPAISAGKIVICERYTDSTLAYQAYGRGFNKQRALAMLNICSFPEPNLTIYFRISPEEAASRIAARAKKQPKDRIEDSGLEFMQRVADGFEQLIDEKPQSSVLVVNAGLNASIDEIARIVQEGVESRLGRLIRQA